MVGCDVLNSMAEGLMDLEWRAGMLKSAQYKEAEDGEEP